MKTKWIGFGILVSVILAAAAYAFLRDAGTVTEINGYVGGEKIGLLEDEEIQKLLKKKYHLSIDYAKAGSIDMISADMTGKNFLFPSNQTALELYEKAKGAPVKSEIVLNTPIVLYTRKPVAQALIAQNIASVTDDISYIHMEKLAQCIEAGKTWADLGMPQLYGSVTVGTTDPTKSNSGNMFAGLLANTLCGGVADKNSLPELLPRLKDIFQRLGYMESSSSDLFDQFLKTGMGAKPLIAGYESQLLEFAAENPDTWKQIREDIVILYPTPTVWSSHVFIALDQSGAAGIPALLDKDIQRLAWEKHGFRTGVYDAPTDADHFAVPGIAKEITQVAPMPDAAVMQQIITALGA
ncbi:MAG: substrate-binding domain-containing protein [Eubacteriales bacterium]|nr:substrate-binding domain-containing protein [Eubacteriales bacterium]